MTTGEGRKPFEKGFSSFPRTPILLSETFYFFSTVSRRGKGKTRGAEQGSARREATARGKNGRRAGSGGGREEAQAADAGMMCGRKEENGSRADATVVRGEGGLGDGRGKTGAAKPPGARQDEEAAPRPSDGGNQPGQGVSLKQKADSKAGPAGQTGGGQASARSLPQKTAESPAKKILPRATSGNVREAFFLAVWRSASSSGRPQKRDASRRSFFAVPRRRCAIPRRCFLHRPIPKAQRSSRPRLSSEPLFLCALPGARPAAQVLRLST